MSSRKRRSRIFEAYDLKPKYHTLSTAVGLVGVVLGVVSAAAVFPDPIPTPQWVWGPIIILVGFPLAILLGCSATAFVIGAVFASLGKITWGEAASLALAKHPEAWFDDPDASVDGSGTYRIEEPPAHKIGGGVIVVCGAFLLVVAIDQGDLLPAAILLLVTVAGFIPIVSSGEYQFSAEEVTYRNRFGQHRMRWLDVQRVLLSTENLIGGQRIVLCGVDQRFTLPPVTAWVGRDVGPAAALLEDKVGGLPSRTSFWAEMVRRRNVRY